MTYTTTRTPEHATIVAHVKHRTEAKGIKFKPTARNNHYYLDQKFDLTSKQMNTIADILSPNTFSFIGNLAVISTEYPVDDQTFENVIAIVKGA